MSISALKNQIRWSVIAGWVLFWILMVAVEIQDFRRAGGGPLWQPILWQLSSAFVITGIIWVLRPMLMNETLLKKPGSWFGRVLLVHPVVCVSFILIVFAIRHAAYRLMGDVYLHEAWSKVFFYETIKLSLFLSLFYVIFFGVQSYSFLIEERENAAQALKLLQQAQLQRLTQQMQPHFLFNALNTVSSLMYSDLKAADSAISRLAELLRASLELNEKNETSLEQEIHMLHAYAELMSLRFVERVEISWQIDTAVLHHRVPVMSLQTILENTFKHTIEKSSGLTHIAIDCRLQENDLILLIQDDKGRLTNSPGGIGIKNLRQRLQAIYGEGAALQIQQVQPAGVATRVRIPQVTQSTHSDAQ